MGSVWKDTHGGMGFCAEGECRRVSWIHFFPPFKLQSFLSIYYLLNILLSNKDTMVNETGQKKISALMEHTHTHTHRKIKKREKVRGKERGGNGVAACPGQVKELVWDLGGDRCRTIAQECEETPEHLSASLKSR